MRRFVSWLGRNKKAASLVAVVALGGTTAGVSCTCNVPIFGPGAPAAAKLAFTTQPAGSVTGAAFTTQPVVKIEDSTGTVVPSDASTVTLSITSGTPATGGPGTLSNCSSIESSGVVTFSNCKLTTTGTGYQLHATDGSLTATDSSTFTVSAGGAATANLWIDSNGGTCTRSGTPAAYSDAAACASMNAALAAASSGDLVLLKCGVSLGDQTFTSNKLTSGSPVTFRSETTSSPGGCATVNSVNYTSSGDFTDVDHVDVPQGFGGSGEDHILDHVSITNNLIAFEQWTEGIINLFHSVSHFTFQGNKVGPACCGNDSSGNAHGSVEGLRISYTGDGCPGSCVANSSNVLIDHNVIQGIVRSCSDYPAGFGSCPDPHGTCADFSVCHADGVHIWGMTDSTISNNQVLGVDAQGIFLETGNGSFNSNINIVGNAISALADGNSTGISVGWHTTNSVGGTWNIDFNSTPANIQVNDNGGAEGGTVVNLVGNIASLYVTDGTDTATNGCAADFVTMNYHDNVWDNLGGATNPTSCETDLTFPGTVTWVNVANDLHLSGGAQEADGAVPAATCAAAFATAGMTAVDFDGNARPVGTNCDAGADER